MKIKAFLDIGNSSVKLSFDKNTYIGSFSYNKVDLVRLGKHIENAELVYISTVNIKHLYNLLSVLVSLPKHPLVFKVFYTKANDARLKILDKINFKNIDFSFLNIDDMLNYKTTVQGIGIDRVLSLYYLSKSYDSFVSVVFGTAITIDIIENKTHKGGFILPNIFLQYKAILDNTDIELDDFSFNYNLIPAKTTEKAVQRGISSVMLLGVSTMLKKLCYQHSIDNISISGGLLDKVLPYLTEKLSSFKLAKFDNLVLAGMMSFVEHL